MIGLDTIVLVRFFARDHIVETRLADRVMGSLSADSPGWLSLPVLMELVWVMSHTYRVSREGIVSILGQLASRDQIVIEQADIVRTTLGLFGGGKAGFADCLIAASARAAGCSRTRTFDKIAARDAGMQLIT